MYESPSYRKQSLNSLVSNTYDSLNNLVTKSNESLRLWRQYLYIFPDMAYGTNPINILYKKKHQRKDHKQKKKHKKERKPTGSKKGFDSQAEIWVNPNTKL